MSEILATIIFVIVQARLTSNDKWLGMTTNDYEKWIRRQSWPESPICEQGINSKILFMKANTRWSYCGAGNSLLFTN